MKHRVINRDKIVEAWVREPEEGHGWQVLFEFQREQNKGNTTLAIDMDTESDCINFINSLNFVKI